MKKILLVTLLALSNVITFSVFASNYSFLKEAPGNYFTKEDWNLFYAAQNKALSNHKDGSKVTWKNPQSGSWGSFVPSHTTKERGTSCRKLTMFNSAAGRTSGATYKFCKIQGEWKVV